MDRDFDTEIGPRFCNRGCAKSRSDCMYVVWSLQRDHTIVWYVPVDSISCMVVVARPYNTQYMRAAGAARVCAPSAGCAGMGSPDKGATQRAKRRKTVPSAKDLEMVEKISSSIYIILYVRTAILPGPRFCAQHMYSTTGCCYE